MPTRDRLHGRNINFFNGQTGEHLGGVLQNGSISNENFFDMLMYTLLDVDKQIIIRSRATGQSLPSDSNPLETGEYDIFCPGGNIRLTSEACVQRILSHAESSRERSFINGIRARDGKCVFTGMVNLGAVFNRWEGFHAAHIFPLEKERLWREGGFARWITNTTRHYRSAINSTQNGMLMDSGVHEEFDGYWVSVNPDDGYKIIHFGHDNRRIDGRVLDPVCRDPTDPNRVSDELLRWHFRQSVLANMKGAGEPSFECDFPPGTDMIGTILEGPCPAEHMEMQLFARLRGFEESHGEDEAAVA